MKIMFQAKFITILLLAFFLISCGESKKENITAKQTEKTTTQQVSPAKDTDRIISYYKKATEWSESDEFQKLKNAKNLQAVFTKLNDIAKSVGYDGKDFQTISKQIDKDYKTYKSDPEVKEWHDKFRKAFK